MILEMYMKNCALIEECRLNINDGLNILTGETGAGKSIIIEALGLCLGEKYDRSFLRKGTNKGVAEILVSSKSSNLREVLDKYDIDYEDDQVVITRVIYSDGKSVARINGRTVKVSILKEIACTIVDLHSQHQNQLLLNKDTHIKFLDLFGEKDIQKLKINYKELYNQFNKVKKELNDLNENKDDMEIQREIDLIKFQIDEIDSANLNEEEYEDLKTQRELCRNSEKIYNNLSLSYERLYEGEINAVDLIGVASKELSDIASFDKTIGEYSENIERIMYELQDISRDIRNYKENISFNPYEMEEIEQRIDQINNLRRKYGNSINEIFEYRQKIQNRLDEILNRDEKVAALKEELEKLEAVLYDKAREISKARKKVAIDLQDILLGELRSLNMKNVVFEVNFREIPFNQNGCDDVEFMASFNLGEDIKPIHKVASGGEMSRFMLAFKTILADIDDIDTLIFDEIDTGISGIAAQIVGEKLSNIGKKKQVICITHLPQIAANGDTHYRIEKNTSNNRTYTHIKELTIDERIDEIARLIAGNNITEKTIEHAHEIIQMAQCD
ncbi:MAG: DNA repair protein RecN [Intestinibacter sp.]